MEATLSYNKSFVSKNKFYERHIVQDKNKPLPNESKRGQGIKTLSIDFQLNNSANYSKFDS